MINICSEGSRMRNDKNNIQISVHGSVFHCITETAVVFIDRRKAGQKLLIDQFIEFLEPRQEEWVLILTRGRYRP